LHETVLSEVGNHRFPVLVVCFGCDRMAHSRPSFFYSQDYFAKSACGRASSMGREVDIAGRKLDHLEGRRGRACMQRDLWQLDCGFV
jgi:hypothetical protein